MVANACEAGILITALLVLLWGNEGSSRSPDALATLDSALIILYFIDLVTMVMPEIWRLLVVSTRKPEDSCALDYYYSCTMTRQLIFCCTTRCICRF